MHVTKDADGVQIVNRTEIPITICGTEYFKYPDQQAVDDLNIEDYLCPMTYDFELLGNDFSDSYSFFSVEAVRWVNGTYDGLTCKTDAEIDEVINTLTIDMTMVNSFFDFDNYDDPVQSFLDDRYFFSTISDYTKEASIYIRNNEYEVSLLIVSLSIDPRQHIHILSQW